MSDDGVVPPPRPEADGIAVWAAGREVAGEWPNAGATLSRTVAAGAVVELHEVTKDTVRSICGLQVAPAQRGFVAPNAVSFAEALFDPRAWYRAIVADGVLVGFVMLSLDPDAADSCAGAQAPGARSRSTSAMGSCPRAISREARSSAP